jgi:hypothetical protein
MNLLNMPHATTCVSDFHFLGLIYPQINYQL